MAIRRANGSGSITKMKGRNRRKPYRVRITVGWEVVEETGKVKQMPFLIRQVLFYLGAACSFYELAPQAEILKVLKENGLNLSHNFYSRMHVADYVNMQKYKQPEMLFPYLGQKHNELGVAVKNLVYQAGDYNLFIDVFGGSCAASLAFPRRNNSVYIYNDLDDGLCNLFDIISDDEDYKTLIEYIRCLQEDLRGDSNFMKEVFGEWNISENPYPLVELFYKLF